MRLFRCRAFASSIIRNACGSVAPLLACAATTASAGTISGLVKFQGEKPQPKPIIEMAANSFCKDHAAANAQFPNSDKFVFGKSGDADTLANVLVYVSNGLEGKKYDAPKNAVLIDQVNCMYAPH